MLISQGTIIDLRQSAFEQKHGTVEEITGHVAVKIEVLEELLEAWETSQEDATVTKAVFKVQCPECEHGFEEEFFDITEG